MPSDLFYEPSVPIDNKFGIITGNFAKELYEKYDKISLRVNRILEVSFGIVYDLYHDWVEFKSVKPSEYEAMIDRFSKSRFNLDKARYAITNKANDILKNSNDDHNWKYNSFSLYTDLVITNTKCSHIGLFSKIPADYLTTISLLRNELGHDSDFNDSIVKIDVGATHNEFPYIKNTEFSEANYSAFAFKVIPTLKKLTLHTTDSMKENTIPEFSYNIEIDINRLIQLIINFYDPSSLKSELAEGENDKNIYIQNGMSKFKNCPEIFTRKIILELFDNYSNIYGNWSQFIKRFKDVGDKFYKDPYITNITAKLSHFNMITPNLESSLFLLQMC